MRGSLNVHFAYVLMAIGAATVGCSPDGTDHGDHDHANHAAAVEEDLCKHEVADKFCPLCHPEIKKNPNVLLCKEHGDIPEEICTACHPELKAKYKTCQHDLPRLVCHTCLAAAGSAKPKTDSSPK